MVNALLIAQSMSLQELAPVLVIAIAVGGLVVSLFVLLQPKQSTAEKRLEDLTTGGMTGRGDAHTGQERFQELIERAAPALARPLQSTNEKELNEIKSQLSYAGFRAENAVTVFTAIRTAFLVSGIGLAFLIVYPTEQSMAMKFCYGFIVAGLMFFLPTFVLSYLRKRRQEQIFLGLPDALDLMVVCVESGLGLDAAMRKVCEEMGRTFPIISEEFSICNFQLQMGRPRRDVLHDIGRRTGVDDMKALAAILIQADKFGSSIAQALRVQSDAMRVRRRQLAEERAAKCAVQLIIPLVLFIFPAIFIVLVGPAAIKIAEELERL